jgi:hypothetical protein
VLFAYLFEKIVALQIKKVKENFSGRVVLEKLDEIIVIKSQLKEKTILQRTELDNFHKKIFSLMGLKNPAKILL